MLLVESKSLNMITLVKDRKKIVWMLIKTRYEEIEGEESVKNRSTQ